MVRVGMRKVVIAKPGGYDRLRIETHDAPAPGRGEVRVDVLAAGVNYADCVVRMGLYESAKKYVGYPITPGFEVAGVVSAAGAGVDWAEGDEVFGVTRFGGYASQIVVPASQLFARPESLSEPQAAAFCAVNLTAWYALCRLAHARAGDVVLVHSAAGGVGGALCQIAKALGCKVVGVVGAAHKVVVAKGHGADVVIDKSHEELWLAAEREAPDGYGVVLDANGVATLGQSYAHLAPGGRLVVYGFHTMLPRGRGKPSWPKLALDWLRTPRFDPIRMTNENRSVLAFNLSYLFDDAALLAEGMGQLLDWLAAGELTPPPVQTFPFEEVADAHRALESAQTTGKLVLLFGEPA